MPPTHFSLSLSLSLARSLTIDRGMTKRPKPAKETGSCFDASLLCSVRAGSHTLAQEPVPRYACDGTLRWPSDKPDPRDFVRNGDGERIKRGEIKTTNLEIPIPPQVKAAAP